MNDPESEKTKPTEHDSDTLLDTDDKAKIEPPIPSRLYQRVLKFINSVQQPGPGTKQDVAKDRTRPMALLIGGTVGVVLLFIGVFSTPSTPPVHETGGRTGPNLGRRSDQSQPPTASRPSVIPLLNADVPSSDATPDQLRPADIQGTSRRNSIEQAANDRRGSTDGGAARSPVAQARESGVKRLPSAAISDRSSAYSSSRVAPPYNDGPSVSSPLGGEQARTYSYGGPSPRLLPIAWMAEAHRNLRSSSSDLTFRQNLH
jgi:hypothetical protein